MIPILSKPDRLIARAALWLQHKSGLDQDQAFSKTPKIKRLVHDYEIVIQAELYERRGE